ncbi:MAG: integrase, partial [bacterium]|nr:integrase [bacterium]
MLMEGPLAPWAAGMGECLKTLGYAPSTVAAHVRLAGRLSRFLQERGLSAAELSSEVVGTFFEQLRARHGSRGPTPKSLVWLIEYLRELGVVAVPLAPAPQSRGEDLVERYRRYLVE